MTPIINASIYSRQHPNQSLILPDIDIDLQPAQSPTIFALITTVCAFILLILCIIGTILNALSLYIFTRPMLRARSINILLAALSAVDMCLLLLAIPVFTSAPFTSLLLPSVRQELLDNIVLFVYPVAVMFQCMSVWLLVIITIERYIAVCHPFTVQQYCSRRRALLVIGLTVFCSFAYNVVRFWEYRRGSDDDDGGGGIRALLRADQLFLLLYQNVATTISQFMMPLVALCVLNLQVARTIMHAGEQRRQLVASERREHNTAKMMLYVVIVFLFCYTFSFILNIAEIVDPSLFANPIGHALNDINNILIVINSSSSFIFYCKYSSRFRAQLKILPFMHLLLPSSAYVGDRLRRNISSFSSAMSSFRTSRIRLSSIGNNCYAHGIMTGLDRTPSPALLTAASASPIRYNPTKV